MKVWMVKMKTHKLTLSAVICAAAVVLMIIGSYVKTGTLALYALLSVMIMAVRAETDTKYAVMSYFVIGVLALILPVDRRIMLSFVCVFGIYPILKAEAEKHGNVLQWIIKLAGFNVCFAALYFLLTYFVGKFKFNPLVVIFAVNAAFVIYDILLSYAYTFYMKNIRHLLIR